MITSSKPFFGSHPLKVITNNMKKDGAELGKAQVKLEVGVEVAVEALFEALVDVGCRVGG